jgi:hypothetical protein
MTDTNVLLISVCIALVVVLLLNMASGNKKQRRRRYVSQMAQYPMYNQPQYPMDYRPRYVEIDAPPSDEYLPERQRGALIANSMTNDYASYMQKTALEPEIFSSHSRYSRDINALNLGPSNIAERSDRGDIIPWVGLRPTNYRARQVDSEARQTPSQEVNTMPTVRTYTLEV